MNSGPDSPSSRRTYQKRTYAATELVERMQQRKRAVSMSPVRPRGGLR